MHIGQELILRARMRKIVLQHNRHEAADLGMSAQLALSGVKRTRCAQAEFFSV